MRLIEKIEDKGPDNVVLGINPENGEQLLFDMTCEEAQHLGFTLVKTAAQGFEARAKAPAPV